MLASEVGIGGAVRSFWVGGRVAEFDMVSPWVVAHWVVLFWVVMVLFWVVVVLFWVVAVFMFTYDFGRCECR